MLGGIIMRFNCGKAGTLAILAGSGILLAVLLPKELWPILLGVGLIGAGICLMKK